MAGEKKQIGWYILSEKKVFTNQFETAAWYEDVEVEPGKYPMYMYDFRVMPDGYLLGDVSAHLPGIVKTDYFGALFCGVPISGYDEKQHTGKEAWAHLHWYGYRVADLVSAGDPRFELLPEYEARQDGEYEAFDGSTRKMYGLYCKEKEAVIA